MEGSGGQGSSLVREDTLSSSSDDSTEEEERRDGDDETSIEGTESGEVMLFERVTGLDITEERRSEST